MTKNTSTSPTATKELSTTKSVFQELKLVKIIVFFTILVYAICVIQSALNMIVYIEARDFMLEPLRILLLVLSPALMSVYWVLIMKYAGSSPKFTSLLELSFIVCLTAFIAVQIELGVQDAIAEGKDLQVIWSEKMPELLKCYGYSFTLVLFTSKNWIRVLLIVEPLIYVYFRFSLYTANPINYSSDFLFLFAMICALHVSHQRRNKRQKKKVSLNEFQLDNSCRVKLNVEISTIQEKPAMNLPADISDVNLGIEENQPKSSNNINDDINKNILNTFPEGVMILNQAGDAIFSNNAMLSLLNCEEDEVIDKLLNLPNKDYLEDKEVSHIYSRPHTLSEINGEENAFGGTSSKPNIAQHSQDQFFIKDKNIQHVVAQPRPRDTFGDYHEEISQLLRSPNSPNFLKVTQLSPEQKENSNRTTNLKQVNLPGVTKRVSQKKSRNPDANYSASAQVHFSTQNIEAVISPLKRAGKKPSSHHELTETEKERKRTLNPNQWVYQDEIQKIKDSERVAENMVQNYSSKKDDAINKIYNRAKTSKYKNVRDTINSLWKKYRKFAESQSNLTRDDVSTFSPHPLAGSRRRSSGLGGLLQLPMTTNIEPEYVFWAELMAGNPIPFKINSYLQESEKKVVQLEIQVRPLVLAKEIHLIIMMKDITDKDIAKRLKEIDRQKNSALAAITHEFRSPLNGILASLDTLKVHLSKNLEPYLEPAFASTKALLNMVNDILDLYQLQAKELRLVFVETSLSDVFENSLGMIRFKAQLKGVALPTWIDPAIPMLITTDPNRLQQIIVNLLSNALKFTEKGEIRLVAKSHGPGKILIQVTDTGLGIKKEDYGKLFKNFGKLDLGADNKLNAQGVGLGLRISNNLAKRLNLEKEEGGLRFVSTFGIGTEFSFIISDMNSHHRQEEEINFQDLREKENEVSLKIQALNNMSKKGLSETRTLHSFDSAPFGKKIRSEKELKNDPNFCSCTKILVTDDDEFNIWALKTLLESLGIVKIDTAMNGEDAVKKVKSKISQQLPCCPSGYRMIFMDFNMPIKNGLEATKEIRALTAFGEGPIIIGCSGIAERDQIDIHKQAGMNNFLIKPIFKDDLMSYLHKYKILS